jgi:2-polyprenyl-3-methyl-5-hydroxy-6-metoxy-1,4-benzoquinol methylase
MIDLVDDPIATAPAPTCYLCGAPGNYLYRNLKDRLFGAPGNWNVKRCLRPGCGLAWLDPMPSQKDIGKAYKNYFTHQGTDTRSKVKKNGLLRQAYQFVKDGYLAQRFGYATAKSNLQRSVGLLLYLLPIRRASIDQGVMGLRARPGRRLLDVGCGNGQLLILLRDLGWQVEGVEIDPAAVEQACASGIKVRSGSLEAQQYPADHFDVVTMSHVLEHVHDPAVLLRECHRILCPGGRLVAVTPNLESWGHRRFRESWRGLEPPRHLFLYTAKSLQMLARNAGFAIGSLRTSPLLAPVIFQASRDIASTGCHKMDSLAPSEQRLKASSFLWLEWALMKLKPNLGEELVLVGEKFHV